MRESDFGPGVSNSRALMAVEGILQNTFGLKRFRPLQAEIIEAILGGHSVLGILPTGAGKSLCYQLPSQVLGGLTLVVSPLIALMRDQVRSLRLKGIWAAALHHHQSPTDQEKILDAVRKQRLSLLYVAPERLRHPRLVRALTGVPIRLLVVDEAHLISEWGHDFRPDYQGIRDFRDRMGKPPILAVTATATPRVKRDIVQALGLDQGRWKVVEGSVDRPNLMLTVQKVKNMDVKVETVAAQAERVDGAVLIYADSRRGTETWARDLSARLKEPVAAYHAGMPAADRQAVEHRFLTRELRVVAATNAFGMGVDRADIRLVAHVGIPESLDAYYQEIGRGGRDGDPAHALMVWQAADLNRRRWRMRQDAPNDQAVTKILQTLAADVVPGEPRFWQWDRTNETIPLIVSLLEEMGYLDVSEKALSSARLAALEHPWPETLGDLINHRLAMQYQYRLRRFEAMEAYLAPDGPCRRSRILEYFGQLSVPAGVLVECCDRCQQSHTPKAPPSPDAHAALRAWRTQQARALGVPPYLILHDRVLQGIVERMPETLEHLSACPGMGPKKLEQFGREILTVLKAHHPGADSWDASDATAIARAFQLFDSNMAFSLVVERIPRTPSTVLTYLERWIAQAEPDTARAYALSLIRSEQYLAISEAFQLEGDDRLRPVMDRLSGMFSYQDLRVARALYRRLGPSGDDAVKPT